MPQKHYVSKEEMTRIFHDPYTVSEDLLSNYYSVMIDIFGDDIADGEILLLEFKKILSEYKGKFGAVDGYTVITEYYGLDNGNKMSLRKIGEQNSRTGGRVATIRTKMLRILRCRKTYYVKEYVRKKLEQQKEYIEKRLIYLENSQKPIPIPLSMPIENLDLSVRALNCLKRYGIKTVSELMMLSKEELLKVRNLGNRCTLEVLEKISSI